MFKKNLRFILATALLLFSYTLYAETINELFRKANNPIAGNPNGKITVVDFFDYQCQHCINMAPVIAAIIKKNSDVRIVFKDYPIRGPLSELAARAAIAANMQGKYFALNHALLTANQPLTLSTILSLAQSNGLNAARLQKDMDSSTVSNQLQSNIKLAETLNITGTPALFIGKTNAVNSKEILFVLGAMSQSELQDAIDRTR